VDLQLQGKRALITGGSRGIGKATARQLALEGVDCAICGRTEATIKAAAAELAAETGRTIVPFVADTSQAESIGALVDGAVAALGGLDILVNNAARVGGSEPEDLDHVTDELILKDFTEKYLGYFRCARAVAPHMRAAGWGRIINISGMAARTAGGFSAGPRNASTAHLTKNLSVELGRTASTSPASTRRDCHREPRRPLPAGAGARRSMSCPAGRRRERHRPDRDRRGDRLRGHVPLLTAGGRHHRRDDPGDGRCGSQRVLLGSRLTTYRRGQATRQGLSEHGWIMKASSLCHHERSEGSPCMAPNVSFCAFDAIRRDPSLRSG
jgi:NAD(P)-dependent dehydrogenase (short-subunit alcohol dehydrogenase family)